MAANTMKPLALLALLITSAAIGTVQAAPREAAGGSTKIINKLQAMVKEITTERDLLKTENEKTVAELAKLKEELKQEKTAALSAEDKLNSELSAQKSSSAEIQQRLDSTTAKLREVIEKYNALNKSKTELANEHANLANNQKMTANELQACESKNLKMYEAAKEIIGGYDACQNKGVMDRLLDSEPVLQIHNVEFESIMQDYEDKLKKQKYQNKSIPNSVNK